MVSFMAMAMVLGVSASGLLGCGFAIEAGHWGKKREMDGWVMGGTCRTFVNNMRVWRVGWNVVQVGLLTRCDVIRNKMKFLIKVDLYIQESVCMGDSVSSG